MVKAVPAWIGAVALLVLAVPAAAQEGPHTVPRPLDALSAYQKKLSKVPVETTGRVTHLLEDDLQGRRHQRFRMRTPQGQRLLIAHDLQAAGRVKLEIGMQVRVRGEYLWNLQGGIIHKTHRSPDNPALNGWIEAPAAGRRYE